MVEVARESRTSRQDDWSIRWVGQERIITLEQSLHRCDDCSVVEIEIHDEVIDWLDSLGAAEWDGPS